MNAINGLCWTRSTSIGRSSIPVVGSDTGTVVSY